MPNLSLDTLWVAHSRKWVLSMELAEDWVYGTGDTLNQAWSRFCTAYGRDPRDDPPPQQIE
jgi:hypothetical protein